MQTLQPPLPLQKWPIVLSRKDEQYSEMYAKFILIFSFDEVYNFEKKKVVSEDFKRKKCIKQIENSFSNIFSDFFSNLLKRMDIRV